MKTIITAQEARLKSLESLQPPAEISCAADGVIQETVNRELEKIDNAIRFIASQGETGFVFWVYCPQDSIDHLVSPYNLQDNKARTILNIIELQLYRAGYRIKHIDYDNTVTNLDMYYPIKISW